jgi:hypothetical protein
MFFAPPWTAALILFRKFGFLFRLTFRLYTMFCQPEQGHCEAVTRAGKLWVECGVGMERSEMT